jgi:hypothetical protein
VTKEDIKDLFEEIILNKSLKQEIFGTEGVDIILHVMKADPKKFQSGLGYSVLLFSTLDSIW